MRLPTPIIRATTGDIQISFISLIEAYVLHVLRKYHKLSIQHVRKALKYAERELGIEHLLIHPDLREAAGDLFLEQYGKLINLNRAGQYAIKEIFKAHLKRIEWEDNKVRRLYPFVEEDKDQIIVIDPYVSFGRPIIQGKGVSTATIVWRINAGESIEAVAEDYGLSRKQVMAALIYEQAA